MLAGFACVGAAYAGPGADGERPAGVESTSSHVPVLIDDDFVDRLADDSGPVAVSMVDGQGFEPDEHGERITRTFLANTNQARLVQTIGYGRYELGGREIRLFVGNGFIRHALRRGGGIFWTATSDTNRYAPRWYEYWFLENGRPFDKDARAVAAWMQNQNTLFIASVENISRRRDGLPHFCDDFDPQEERGWEPLCGLLRDYIAHSGVGLDKALWVGALDPEPSATGMSFATGAIRADGVFAPHTIYVESPDASTSHATAVLAAYATNLAYSNPDWGAARLKQELIALAQDEEVRYLEGDAHVGGSLIARNRVVKVIRPAFAPKGEPPLTGECVPGAETLCLQESRYEVRAVWRTPDGRSGVAQTVEESTGDSGMFWFFEPDNWEILIKVLKGCSNNGNVWVFGASTTDLGYEVTVRDSVLGRLRRYVNEPGVPAPAITDLYAFPEGCRETAAVAD